MTALVEHVSGDRYVVVGWLLSDDEAGEEFDARHYDAVSVQWAGGADGSVVLEGSTDGETWGDVEPLSPLHLTPCEGFPRYLRPQAQDADAAQITLYAVRWTDETGETEAGAGVADRLDLRFSRVEFDLLRVA